MLTLSQRKTLEFIQKFISANDYAPTAAEIATGIGIKSRGVVHRYLKALQDMGYLSLTPNRHRNIVLRQTLAANANHLPLLGAIAAGSPIEAIEQHESIDVMGLFLGDNRFALRVKGSSMIDEGILDGDLVVCERADTANNGQIVVAIVDELEATLKRLKYNQDHTVSLIPANEELNTMIYPAERVRVQGIYVGLLRLS